MFWDRLLTSNNQNSIASGEIIVSLKVKYANLAKTKLALAEKCERLVKTCNSKPKQKTLKNQAQRFRRMAEQYARM